MAATQATAGGTEPRSSSLGRVRAVFTKEVWIVNKRPSTAWTRLLLAAITAGLCVLALLVSMSHAGESASQIAQNAAEAGKAITITIVMSQFVLLTLVGAAFASGGIYEERSSGALGTLLSSPIRAWELVAGKVLGRASELLVLLLLSAPLLLAFRGMGGVSPAVLLGALALLLSALVVAVCVGLCVSARATSSSRAVAGAISVLLTVWVVIPVLLLLVWTLSRFLGLGVLPLQGVILVLSTPVVVVTLLTDVSNAAGVSFWELIAWNLVVNALWSVLAFLLAVLHVRWLMRTGAVAPAKPARSRRARPGVTSPAERTDGTAPAAPAPSAPPLDAASRATDEAGMPATPTDAAASRRRSKGVRAVHPGSSRIVGDNPVLWRETQQPIFSGRFVRWGTLIAVPLLMVLAYIATELEAMVELGSMIGLFVCLAFASTSATGAIASEREARTLETLQTTPLSSKDLVLGKFLPALRVPVIVLLFMMGNALLAGVFGEQTRLGMGQINLLLGRPRWLNNPDAWSPLVLLLLPLITLPPVLAITALGLWIGCVAKKAATATVATIGCALAAWLVGPIAMAMLSEMSDSGRLFIFNYGLISNPFAMMAGILQNQAVDPRLPVLDGRGVEDGVAVAAGIGLYFSIYVGLAWLMLRRAARAVRAVRTGRT